MAETIQKLMKQQRKMHMRQNRLRKCLATAYENRYKGSSESFVPLSNQFKECDKQKEARQNIQASFETAQQFQDGFARFKKGGEGQVDIKFFDAEYCWQVIDWIAGYPASRVPGHISRKAKFIVASLGKLRKFYKPLIMRECSYSICPIQEREYKSNKGIMRE